MKRTLSATATLALLATAIPAAAQDRDEDREYRHIARIQADHPEDALARYQALYDRSRSPRALAQIAGVEAQMGRWVLASEHMTAALAATGDAWITRNRASLEQIQTRIREHVSDLMIVANVAGARISVNGEARGTLPLAQPLRVVAGQARVELSADGYETLRQSVEATPGRARSELTLIPVAAPTRVAVAVTPVATTPAPAPAPAPAPTPAPAPVAVEATSSPLRALGIASAALGAVGIGLGVAGIVLRNGSVATFTDAGCYVQNDAVMGGGSCQSEYDSGNAMGAMGTAGFVAGGVFTAAGIAMIVAAPGPRSGERRATLSCGWGPGTVGVGCGGTF